VFSRGPLVYLADLAFYGRQRTDLGQEGAPDARYYSQQHHAAGGPARVLSMGHAQKSTMRNLVQDYMILPRVNDEAGAAFVQQLQYPVEFSRRGARVRVRGEVYVQASAAPVFYGQLRVTTQTQANPPARVVTAADIAFGPLLSPVYDEANEGARGYAIESRFAMPNTLVIPFEIDPNVDEATAATYLQEIVVSLLSDGANATRIVGIRAWEVETWP